MSDNQKLYMLTTKIGVVARHNGRYDGKVAMTKDEIFARIGKGDPLDFNIYELVPTQRRFVKSDWEIV